MLGLYNSTLNYLSAVPGSEHYAKFGFRIFYGSGVVSSKNQL
jgi:hypothetical protein